MKRIVLSGYYGFDNAGDEAVLAGLIRGFRSRQGASTLVVDAHSIAPDSTRTAQGIEASHRMRLGPVMRSLAGADLVASGGGSLLQDSTSAYSIFYYLAIVRLAQMMGKRTMFIAQGIGPLTLKRSRKLTASVANRLDAITVRDEASAQLLAAIGCRKPVSVTADPALLLGDVDAPRHPSGVAVSLRMWRDQTAPLAASLAKALIVAVPGAPITAMPMHAGADEEAQALLIEALSAVPVRSTSSLSDLLACAANAEMVVGMRLHSLIFAAAFGTPSVALSYDPKVAAFMAQTGQGDAVYDIEHRDASILEAVICRVWNERGDRAAKLRGLLPELRARAQRNADIALELVGLKREA